MRTTLGVEILFRRFSSLRETVMCMCLGLSQTRTFTTVKILPSFCLNKRRHERQYKTYYIQYVYLRKRKNLLSEHKV